MRISKDNIVSSLIKVMLVFSVLISAAVICWFEGKTILQVYLPAGWCSDEVSYYKLSEAILHNGIPQGYWGYYESHAKIGSFGPWTPFSLCPYVIWGSLFRWNFYSPILCNSILFILAFVLFIFLAKPSNKEMVAIMLVVASMPWIARYSISAMLEAYVISLEIIYVGFFQSLKGSIDKYKVVGIYIITFLLFIERPYFLVLVFVPLIFSSHKKIYKNVAGLLAVSSIMAITYVIVSRLFCSPYVPPYTYRNTLPKVNIIASIFNNIIHCRNLLFTGGETYGYGYFLLMTLVVITCVDLFRSVKRKERQKSYVDICILGILNAIFLAVLILYDPSAGSRHIFQVVVLCELLFTFNSGELRKRMMLLVCVNIAVFMLYTYDSSFIFAIPDSSTAQEKIKWSNSINGEQIFVQQPGVSWENTLAVDASTLDYNYVYYLPDWLGIQLTWEDFYSDKNFESIQSGYVMTMNGSDAAKACRKNGWKLLSDDYGISIYKNLSRYR